MAKPTGLGNLPTGLLRPTAPAEPAGRRDEPPAPDDAEAQGRGEGVPEARAPRARRKRAPAGSATRGRKLHLPDDIHDRLWLLARQRRTTVSAVATELLDRNLPRFRVEREG